MTSIEQFSGRRYINLESYKKNGEPKLTPVQSLEHEGLIYVRTDSTTWKVKRIRRNPHVRVVPSNSSGKPIGGMVRGGGAHAGGRREGSDVERLQKGIRGTRILNGGTRPPAEGRAADDSHRFNQAPTARIIKDSVIETEEAKQVMKIIVVYASKYGYTKGIAEFVGEMLRQRGILAEVRDVEATCDLGDFDALVIGSAVYMGHWMKEATEFVRRNHSVLATRPVWLFSSGPLGTKTKDAQGRDLIVVSEPKEIAGFRDAINPRDHRVFFGALDPKKLGFAHGMTRKLPAARAVLPEGDFRDWNDIEAWANSIAQGLTTMGA